MSDVSITRLAQSSRPGKEPKGLRRLRVTDSNGTKVTIRSIDAHSPTFGDDLLYVFARNVEEARRENKRIIGAPSGVDKGR